MNQRQEIGAEIAVAWELLREVADRLSRSRLVDAEELLRNDEPHEALLGIAWDLASQSREVNEGIVRRIREATGNSEDLPPSFRSPGPVGTSTACALAIPTPLGPLTLTVGYRGASPRSGLVTAPTPSGGQVHQWPVEDALAVQILITPYDGLANMPQYSVTASWGAVVTLSAQQNSPDVEIIASLPDEQRGSPDFGQFLASYEFETPDWQLSVGGPDDDLFAELIRKGALPAAWKGLFADPGEPETGYGFFTRGSNELGWLLPSLPAGATVASHVAVAWGRPSETANVSNWYAVLTSPSALTDASVRPAG